MNLIDPTKLKWRDGKDFDPGTLKLASIIMDNLLTIELYLYIWPKNSKNTYISSYSRKGNVGTSHVECIKLSYKESIKQKFIELLQENLVTEVNNYLIAYTKK